jgi:hypothetical protein
MWSWSHTPEAYAFTMESLWLLPKEELTEIAQAWNEEISGLEDPTRDECNEEIKPFDAFDMSNDIIARWIWGCCSNWQIGRNCSNGGHEMYSDPQGYHTVDLRDMSDDWQPDPDLCC